MYAANRVIVVDIGSQDGFLKGGRLIYKANCSTGDYHGQMHGVIFEKWIKEHVLPNLPDDSVVVIDNTPYHEEQVDKEPSKRATKRVMIEWLQRHEESYDEKATRKAVLYEAVQRLKPPRKIYKIDNLLKEKGHTVLRLPSYMCDLNAIEFVWAQVKQYVRHNNASGEDGDDSSSSDSSDDPSDPESDEELAVPLPMDTDTSTENKMFSK
ncbi:uncharacterized protein LOC124363847 [Homalodisca vitripennis]|uniref:uncharacterized protein LOC124363847 n=1 Tax=Homalodisca vitripennis TaxID=197043 RepID=UPI001EEC141B|nr:uncharacterized protein LOC124363847 [Homalodisca vitripennis]